MPSYSISLSEDLNMRAVERAKLRGETVVAYIRMLVIQDLNEEMEVD